MSKQDFMELLQFKRHELMNHLQMIQGYIHLDKKDAALEKVSAIVHEENQERKLIHLNIPTFTWWLLLLPLKYPNLRLKYEIQSQSKELSDIDRVLYKYCKQIMETATKLFNESQSYEMKLQLLEGETSETTTNIAFFGDFGHLSKREFRENDITYRLNEDKDKMKAIFTVANKKV